MAGEESSDKKGAKKEVKNSVCLHGEPNRPSYSVSGTPSEGPRRVRASGRSPPPHPRASGAPSPLRERGQRTDAGGLPQSCERLAPRLASAIGLDRTGRPRTATYATACALDLSVYVAIVRRHPVDGPRARCVGRRSQDRRKQGS